jgi:hypothetical protein
VTPKLIASCLYDARRHTALIDVSRYPAETEAIRVSNEARDPRTVLPIYIQR